MGKETYLLLPHGFQMRKVNIIFMPKKSKAIILHLALFLIICFAFKNQFSLAKELGPRLSPLADPYSEANAYREAVFFVEKGFFTHYGLGDTNYGHYYPQEGHKSEKEIKGSEPFIYTHYPPGPAYILSLIISFFGKENFFAIRILPVIFAVISLFFYLETTIVFLGKGKALVMMFLLLLLPATTNMAHGIHYQGYGYSFFFLLAGILQLFASGKLSLKKTLPLIWTIAFIQGYLSFDFFFLISFFPVFLLATSLPLRTIALLCIATTAGFLSAHLLHYLQVILWFGNFSEAFNDLFAAAKHRGTSPVPLLETVGNYLFLYFPSSDYFSIHIFWYHLPLILFFAVGKFQPPSIVKHLAIHFSWTTVIAAIFAFIITHLWVIVMKGHAAIHSHFIPRHYLYMIFSYATIILCNIHFKEPLEKREEKTQFYPGG